MKKLTVLAGLLCGAAWAQGPDVVFPFRQVGQDAGLGALYLQPSLGGVLGLEGEAEVRLTGVPLPAGGTVDLLLERLPLERSQFGFHLDGQPAPQLLEGLHLSVWRGEVEGLPGSVAMLGFSPYGTRGWIQMGSELVHVLPQPGAGQDWSAGLVVLISEESLNAHGWQLESDCLTPPTGPGSVATAAPVRQSPAPPTMGLGSCSTVTCSVALECDTQLYGLFGNASAAATYVATLWTFIGDRYLTQANTVLTHPYVNIPTTGSDPWTSQDSGGNSVDLLYEFQAAWAGNIPLGCRTALFMSGAALGGGVAWLGVLCDNTYNFAVCGNINSNVNFPVAVSPSNWDFMVCAHELGHNFDALHTHSYCPPLDECAPSGYFGSCQTAQVCTNQGTIMSYCHLCSGGTSNITTYFHTQSAADMTAHAAACLPAAASASADHPSVLSPGVPTPVTLTTTASPATPPTIWFAADGVSFSASAMQSAGVGTFTGSLPAANCGDSPAYYYEVNDPACGNITLPAGGASAPYTAVVGTLTLAVDDEFEVGSGWTAGAAGDTATTGIWERGDPNSTAAQPEDDHTPSGTDCWFTGQAAAGAGVGTNDVDGGTTTLLSPLYDLSGMASPTISYWRWYSNSAGSAPNADTFDIDISNDGGSTWSVLEVVGPTTQNSGGWIQASFDVASFVTPTAQVRLRFRASDLGSGSIIEAALDDLQVSEFACAGGSGLGTRYCTPALANSSGSSGEISLSGSDQVAANNLTMTASSLPSNQFGIFVTAANQGSISVGSGILCLSGALGRFPGVLNSGAAGTFSSQADLSLWPVTGSSQVQVGETWNFTAWFRDIGGTSNFTDAVGLTFQ